MNMESQETITRKFYKESLHQVISSFTKNNLPLESLPKNSIQELVQKVTEDINFLEDRIERVKDAHMTNPIVLQTYENMLESRRAVLNWLEESGLKVVNDSEKLDQQKAG